jgi:hypothetical protein
MVYSNATSKYTLNADDASHTVSSQNGEAMQVFVKDLTGKAITLDVYTTTTAAYVKKCVLQQCLHVDPRCARLVFGGKQLEDNRTLAECGVNKEATLELVLRLKGGVCSGGSKRVKESAGTTARNKRAEAFVATRKIVLADAARVCAGAAGASHAAEASSTISGGGSASGHSRPLSRSMGLAPQSAVQLLCVSRSRGQMQHASAM